MCMIIIERVVGWHSMVDVHEKPIADVELNDLGSTCSVVVPVNFYIDIILLTKNHCGYTWLGK